MPNTTSLRDRLRADLAKPAFQGILQQFKAVCPIASPYTSWSSLIDGLHKLSIHSNHLQSVVESILVTHRQHRDPRWPTLLTAIFLPVLLGISRRRRNWDRDDDDRLQNLVLAFLEVIDRVDPAKRQQQLCKKIINDTGRRLYDGYRDDWDRAQCVARFAEEYQAALTAPRPQFEDHQSVEIAGQKLITVLETCRRQGAVNEADLDLILQTKVHSCPLAQYARQRQLSYEGAKKRLQRALHAVRLHVQREFEGDLDLVPAA